MYYFRCISGRWAVFGWCGGGEAASFPGLFPCKKVLGTRWGEGGLWPFFSKFIPCFHASVLAEGKIYMK